MRYLTLMSSAVVSAVVALGCTCVAWAQSEFRIAAYDGYATPELVSKFTAEVKAKLGKDIKVKVITVGDNSDVFAKLREKAADVTAVTNNGIKNEKFKMISAGLLQPVSTSSLKNYTDLIPAMQNADFISQDGKTYGVPFNYGPYGLAYNQTKGVATPSSWSVLFEPNASFATSSDWPEANIAVAALAAGVDKKDVFDLEKVSTPAVRAKLDILGQKAARKWKGVDDAATLKGLSYATSWSFAFADLAKQNETWAMANPVEGMPGYVDSFAITSGCSEEMKPVALAWLDFIIAPETQAAYTKTLGVKLVNPKAKSFLSAEEAIASKIDDPQWFTKNVILLKALDIRTENSFQKMWESSNKK